MSTSLKTAEITVRVIVLIFQVLALIGGALLLGLYPDRDNPAINGIGVATIVVAVIISIYEVLMIIFALIEHVNHPARLVVDIILNSVMAGLTIVTTIGVIILAVILFIILIAFAAGLVVAIFALPIGLGVIFSILFIVSAVSAGIIRSKLIDEARELQSSSVVVAPPPGPTFVLVQQPTTVGQPGVVYPPSYDTTFGQAPVMPVTSDPAAGANYNYGYQSGNQAGYPSASGTGDSDQKAQNPTTVSYGQKVPAQ